MFPVQWPVGPLLVKISTVDQTSNYATDYSYVK